jgi:anti-sigma B factor antagonist
MTDPAAPRPSTPARLWTLHIDRETRDGVRILGVRGRIGAAASPRLAAALTEELSAGHPRIVLDLDGVDYMSSAGLRVVQAAAARAAECGARLALCRLPEPVRVAFDLAGVMAEFTIEASCDAAAARLKQTP